MLTNKLRSILIGMQEGLTGYMAVIQSDHAYVHASLSYTIALDAGTISSAYYVALETPTVASGKEIHFRPTGAGITTDANAVKYVLYEAPTSYTGGTAYTPFNRNRDSVQTSQSTVKYGVTPTLGTAKILDIAYIGTAGNPSARGGGQSGGGVDEIILKAETTYIFAFTPGGSTNASFTVFWYEENA
jgi:hypothetical protein